MWTKFRDLDCGVEVCPDYSYLYPMMSGWKPCPTLMRKMDTAAMEMQATTTLRIVDAMQFWIGDKMTPKIEDAWAPKELSAVTRMPCADYAMTMMIRVATGSPSTETTEPEESNEEDEEVGGTKLLPRRAAAAKLSPRRAAAAKLLAKGTKLSAMRQAARRLGLGYNCCHEDCSPQMRCRPKMYCSHKMYEMYGCPKMYEKYGCPEMTAATENHERFDTTSPFPPVEDRMQDYKVFGASTNLTALQPGRWSISSSVQCCQAALQLQTLVPCGAGSSAAAYCCALQRFAEQASVDCEPAQHQALRHHTWPGAARCVGKTDPPRPVKRGDSDSRKIHDQTKIPIPEQFQQVVS